MYTKIIMFVSLISFGATLGWFLSDTQNITPATTPESVSAPAANNQEVPATITATDFISIRPAISTLPEQALSTEEITGLIFMREEEKLARDVYSTLFDTWDLPIFSNIAQSEQTHTEAVKTILTKYDIADPVVNDSVGVFTNTDLQDLYDDLSTQGRLSIKDALTVGATIEDLDISDLQKQLSLTDNDDIKLVYENLLRGSRNHLRSFVAQLTSLNTTYAPTFITQVEFESIISSGQETGSGHNNRGWGKNK
jgi:hypothetical protein